MRVNAREKGQPREFFNSSPLHGDWYSNERRREITQAAAVYGQARLSFPPWPPTRKRERRRDGGGIALNSNYRTRGYHASNVTYRAGDIAYLARTLSVFMAGGAVLKTRAKIWLFKTQIHSPA